MPISCSAEFTCLISEGSYQNKCEDCPLRSIPTACVAAPRNTTSITSSLHLGAGAQRRFRLASYFDMNPKLFLSICCLLFIACGDNTFKENELNFRAQSIIDGVEDPGHPEVGLLLIGAQGGVARTICTATVIGTSTLLTAAHCCSANERNIFQIDGMPHEVKKVIPHSGWQKSNPYQNDIGLVILEDTLTIKPGEAASQPPQAGMPVTLVGYGRTSDQAEDSGKKRKAVNSIAGVASDGKSFNVSGTGNDIGNSCLGDSGGPVFAIQDDREVILGVISAAQEICGTNSFHVSVAKFLDWVISNANGDIYQIDTTKPEISIEQPQDKDLVENTLVLKITAKDNIGVIAVEAFVDGTSAGTSKTAPCQFTLTLGTGQHGIKVTAMDRAGNSASAEITVTVGSDPTLQEAGHLIPKEAGPSGDGGMSHLDEGVNTNRHLLRGSSGCNVIFAIHPRGLRNNFIAIVLLLSLGVGFKLRKGR